LVGEADEEHKDRTASRYDAYRFSYQSDAISQLTTLRCERIVRLTKVPPINKADYRQGYEDGVEASKTPGADVVRSVFVGIESPSYRKGWNDGYHERDFDPGEQGLFGTDTEEDEEEEDTEDGGTSESNYSYGSSGGYESSSTSSPVSLTKEQESKQLFGRIAALLGFCASLVYDLVLTKAIDIGSFFHAVVNTILVYVAYRVVYRLKFWVTPLLALNVVLFFYEIKTTPFFKVMHDIVASDIANLAGLALIYGIYKFFTE
jgi:hypothetical protein